MEKMGYLSCAKNSHRHVRQVLIKFTQLLTITKSLLT